MIDQSLWRAATLPNLPAAKLPNEVDVVVVGAGITGLTAAWLLKQAGKRVAVFERETIGSGETGNTSAHLTAVTDLRLGEMAKRFGDDAARLVWEGNARAIDLIETIVSDNNISCGFNRVPAFLCSSFVETDDQSEEFHREAALATQLGIDAQYVTNGPMTGKPALSFGDQALFHPLLYVSALAQLVHGNGSVVVEHAEVSQVLLDPMAVVVNGENVACADVIIATHVPIVGAANLVGAILFQTKLYPYSPYVLGARVNEHASPGLYFDTSNPYYFLRVHEDGKGKYAIFGGEDHKTGVVTDTEACYSRLEAQLQQLIPGAVVERRWSGQVVETADGLPYIGKTADHQYAATGYAGNGLTFGTLAAMMLTDAIDERENPLASLLDPHRKARSPGALGTLIGEGAAYPYHMIRDRLRARGHSDIESISQGDGQVLTINGKRVACHRTDDGALIKVSAVCTHLGCLVRWNSAERTWDCPCHGSRFTTEGLVLGGPAETPLERID